MARILVIDDTKNIRKMVCLTLEKLGHEMYAAENGVKGLERFLDGTLWDLTLIDQRMPELEGIDVVREAKLRNPSCRLIMMTAFASLELATEALRLGAVDFLRKPFTTVILRGAVETALNVEPTPWPTEASTPEEVSELLQPGHPGFAIPSLSYRINGYSFWPVTIGEKLSMEFGRWFQIHSPDGSFTRTFAGITLRVKSDMQNELERTIPDEDPLWDRVCGQAIVNYIWGKSATPPTYLPVYELPTDLRHHRPTVWK